MTCPLNVVVIDDEPPARDELVFLLNQCDAVEVVGEAANAAEAQAVCEHKQPDVVFIDLRMPGPDGVTIAETLLARHPELVVVIVSAHDDGAIRAFEARVLDYLLKPVRLERLQKTLDRAREYRQDVVTPGEHLDRVAVRRRDAYVVLDIADVIYFETKDELVWAVTQTDRFALDRTLAALERGLDPEVFFRCHRGVIVRLDRIVAIEPTGAGTYQLLLDHPDQARVPLARERAKHLRERIPFTG